jgi:PPOX class probable F420-dependent enzyme
VVTDPAPSRRLSGDQVLDDSLVRELLRARLVGVLATLDAGGTIHAVPMWFVLHDRSILLATSQRSRKVGNLVADGRATLVLHDSRAGFEVCGASIVGRAEIVRGLEAGPLIGRVHRRYVEAERLPDEARAFLESDDVALRFHPQAALTWDERASDANAALKAAGGALPLVSTEPRRP